MHCNIRSNSLIWATITAYSLLIVCTMLIYDMQYLNFVIYRLVHDIVSVHHKYNIELYKLGGATMTNTLRVERAIKHMTQQQLAEAIGVSRQTINAIESGKYVPSTLLSLKTIRNIRKDCK